MDGGVEVLPDEGVVLHVPHTSHISRVRLGNSHTKTCLTITTHEENTSKKDLIVPCFKCSMHNKVYT